MTLSKKELRVTQALHLARTDQLIAPESFKLASVHELVLVCNGCGAANAKFDFVPDRIYGTYIGWACIIHDWQYFEGVTAKDKRIADKVFRKNLIKIIQREEKWYKPKLLMRSRALGYYLGVKFFGDGAYWNGKNKA